MGNSDVRSCTISYSPHRDLNQIRFAGQFMSLVDKTHSFC